jgi:hypothetical protein
MHHEASSGECCPVSYSQNRRVWSGVWSVECGVWIADWRCVISMYVVVGLVCTRHWLVNGGSDG